MGRDALEAQRRYNLKHDCKRRYKITPEQYHHRMSTTNQCEICGTFDNLCYDHCHDTMNFRGVLCKTCNAGIGMLGDRLKDVRKAVAYLEKPCYTINITDEEDE